MVYTSPNQGDYRGKIAWKRREAIPLRVHPALRTLPYLFTLLIHNSLITPLLGGGDSLEPRNSPQGLQLILFENYPYRVSPADNPPHYHAVDLPSAEFPQQFSSRYAPFPKLQKFTVPEGSIEIPRKLILLDIHTLSESALRGKKVSYQSPVGDLSYQLKVDRWRGESYQITLSGEYKGFKFRDILFQGQLDRTKLVAIRKTARQTLFAVLTPVQAIPLFSVQEDGVKDFEPPQLIEGPQPLYPEGLSETGRVLIRGIITTAGRLDPDRFILLECPHPLLGRSALETILNDWTFRPGRKDGQPVEALTTIEVEFVR